MVVYGWSSRRQAGIFVRRRCEAPKTPDGSGARLPRECRHDVDGGLCGERASPTGGDTICDDEQIAHMGALGLGRARVGEEVAILVTRTARCGRGQSCTVESHIVEESRCTRGFDRQSRQFRSSRPGGFRRSARPSVADRPSRSKFLGRASVQLNALPKTAFFGLDEVSVDGPLPLDSELAREHTRVADGGSIGCGATGEEGA